MDIKERLSESNMYIMDRLVQWFKSDFQNSSMLQQLEWTQESGLYRKQTFYNKLDRVVQWLKSDLQNGHKRAAFRKQHVCYGQAGTTVLE
jgi:hypothetical protein